MSDEMGLNDRVFPPEEVYAVSDVWKGMEYKDSDDTKSQQLSPYVVTSVRKESFIIQWDDGEGVVEDTMLFTTWERISRMGRVTILNPETNPTLVVQKVYKDMFSKVYTSTAQAPSKVWTEENLPDVITIQDMKGPIFKGEIYTFDLGKSLMYDSRGIPIPTSIADNIPSLLERINKGVFKVLDDKYSSIPKEVVKKKITGLPVASTTEGGLYITPDKADWSSEHYDKYRVPVKFKGGDSSKWTASHYDNYYTLTEEDIEAGKVRLDAYTVNRAWKCNSIDDTGALFHVLKTVNRAANSKNPFEREVVAMYKQVLCLAKMHNIELPK